MPKVDIPPGVIEAVRREARAAFLEALGETKLLDLQECHERLEAVEIRARNAEQIALTYQEIARLQGDKIQWLEGTITELRETNTQHHVEIAGLRAQVARVNRAS